MRSETGKAVVEGGGPWPSLSRAVVFDSSSSSPLAPGVDLSVEELWYFYAYRTLVWVNFRIRFGLRVDR